MGDEPSTPHLNGTIYRDIVILCSENQALHFQQISSIVQRHKSKWGIIFLCQDLDLFSPRTSVGEVGRAQPHSLCLTADCQDIIALVNHIAEFQPKQVQQMRIYICFRFNRTEGRTEQGCECGNGG